MSYQRYVYRPIKPYQTRLLSLFGDKGAPDSQLECSLYAADILHSKFQGLGVRAHGADQDFIVEYDALSYTWGGGESTKHIICDGFQLPITGNLFDALSELRLPQQQGRYLWVDSICINQASDSEKSEQVWNMFVIYQKATEVIAWLGPSHENVEDVLVLAASLGSEPSPYRWQLPGYDNIIRLTDPSKDSTPSCLLGPDAVNLENISRGMSYLYSRPWFQRMWVQQEIYAARKLKFQCGVHQFDWPRLLSEPTMLLQLPHLESSINTMKSNALIESNTLLDSMTKSSVKQEPYRWRKAVENTTWNKKRLTANIPGHVLAHLDAIYALNNVHTLHLECFERFNRPLSLQPDFIETLLRTSVLQATNPKDYIYGIVGMTQLPARAMSIQEWMKARQHEVFIPIDYTADLTSISIALTWVLLLEGGLAVLAKFKVFEDGDVGTREPLLPSWAVDWRLAARYFVGPKSDLELARTLCNAWHHLEPIMVGGSSLMKPGVAPSRQRRLQVDNMSNAVSCKTFLVRGQIIKNLYAKDRSVWETRELLPDKEVWKLTSHANPEDLVVQLTAFVTGVEISSWWSRGLWLLRPMGRNEFKLTTCLLFSVVESFRGFQLYWQCGVNRDSRYRPLAVCNNSYRRIKLQFEGKECCFTLV